MSLLLVSALLAVSTSEPENGREWAFVTYVDARTGPDLIGGFWESKNSSDVVGNVFTFEQKLLFADKGAVLGLHTGYCIRTDPGGADSADAPGLLDDAYDNYNQCEWTVTFENGTVTKGNTLTLMQRRADINQSRSAIVGGTGAFMGAYGWATWEPEAASNGGYLIRQAFNFTIDISNYEGVTSSPATSAPQTYSPGSSVGERMAIVRVANVTVAEIQTGMVAFKERLRQLTNGDASACQKICALKKVFRSTEYVQDACYSCYGEILASRVAQVQDHDVAWVYDIYVSVSTKYSQSEVDKIITNNFMYLVAAISPYATLDTINHDSDSKMPGEQIFAIVLISVVAIGVVVAFLFFRKSKTPEEAPKEEEEVAAEHDGDEAEE
eukprot:TRINITY_DN10176_c1_g1_i1.p1 TRINITY_DN10176_c1_g1~~TRINITY_DN10176_c1_g1_i1.p1  ORF type:complete len:382 (+),score=122.58 TRINITY_DN10176_c1_g1_i1:83-1228(+)